jgi:glucose/arabinose dehydrogenase
MKCLRLLPSLSIGLVVLAPPVGAVETVLLGDAAPAAALIPSAANGGNLLGQTWTAESFDATGWLTGVTGIGFDATPAQGGDYTGVARLSVAAMEDQNSTVFIRIPFTVPTGQLAGIKGLTLRMQYDDGFVAYINGSKVASALEPANLSWNSATLNGQGHTATVGVFEDFDITPSIGELHEGQNLLAIQGLNSGNGSSDLLILPEIVATDVAPPAWPQVRFVEVPGIGPVDFPVAVRNAGDGTNRLFILERRGRIKVLYNGVLSTFLDISDRVQSSTTNGDEQGLLGLAFPPGFGISKTHFYVYYTTRVAPNGGDQVLARFSLIPTVPPSGVVNAASPGSEDILIRFDDPAGNHNGGDLHFGSDGFLYLGLGDGGSGNDPDNRAQNPNDLWGKMLRLDVESTIGTPVKYAVPSTNPFVGTAGVRPEIWHLGLRNPWRWSFDRLTGAMWIGDVGQGAYEEVSYAPPNTPALNFGWRRYEGLHPGAEFGQTQITLGTLTDPVSEVAQSTGDRALTGGYVYRGTRFPTMEGIYFFGDYGSGRIYGVQPAGTAWVRSTLSSSGFAVSSFGEDEQGELYVADLQEAGPNTGKIYQVGDLTDAGYLTTGNVTQDPDTLRITFEFGAAVGRSYQVMTSTDLVTWSPVGGVIVANAWTMTFTDPADPPAQPGGRFYRVDEL